MTLSQTILRITIFSLLCLSISSVFSQNITREGYTPDLLPKSLFRSFPCGGETILDEGFEAGIPSNWQVLDLDGLSPNENIALPPVALAGGDGRLGRILMTLPIKYWFHLLGMKIIVGQVMIG